MSALALAALLLMAAPASTQAAAMPSVSSRGVPAQEAAHVPTSEIPRVSRWQTVAYGDLDLTTVAGVQALTARINTAAFRTCAELHGRSLAGRSDCQAEFRNQAMAALPDEVHQEYASYSRSTIDF